MEDQELVRSHTLNFTEKHELQSYAEFKFRDPTVCVQIEAPK